MPDSIVLDRLQDFYSLLLRRRRGTRPYYIFLHYIFNSLIPHPISGEVAQARLVTPSPPSIFHSFSNPQFHPSSESSRRPNQSNRPKMRPTQLLSSLYLAQAAVAAPILLLAGSSAKAVFIRPSRQMTVAETAQIVLEATQDKQQQRHHASTKPSSTGNAAAAALLDAEGPLTTADLMALSQVSASSASEQQQEQRPAQPHAPSKPSQPITTTTLSSNKGKISVGTLVVPGSQKTKTVMASLFDPSAPRPYLIPGYYVSSQRADILVVGIILAFVLVVLAVETWGPVSRTYVQEEEENPQYMPMAMHAC